jgi:hypothetical protein
MSSIPTGPGGGTMGVANGRQDSTDTKYTEVNATIVCIDLRSMSIVFKDIYRKKKDNSNFLQFTDADVRNKMNELDNSLVSKVYDDALKAIFKELQKNDK